MKKKVQTELVIKNQSLYKSLSLAMIPILFWYLTLMLTIVVFEFHNNRILVSFLTVFFLLFAQKIIRRHSKCLHKIEIYEEHIVIHYRQLFKGRRSLAVNDTNFSVSGTIPSKPSLLSFIKDYELSFNYMNKIYSFMLDQSSTNKVITALFNLIPELKIDKKFIKKLEIEQK